MRASPREHGLTPARDDGERPRRSSARYRYVRLAATSSPAPGADGRAAGSRRRRVYLPACAPRRRAPAPRSPRARNGARSPQPWHAPCPAAIRHPAERRQQTADGHRRRRTAALVTAHAIKAPATLTIGALAAMAVIGLAALSAVLTVVAAHGTCSDAGVEAAPSDAAKRAVPATLPQPVPAGARGSGVPWTVLAAIGSIETDHGRSRAPGVRSGVNRHGCCAGPMQFNTRDGPPSTWERYGVDANHDGTTDIYDPDDAIPSAAAYLSALLRRAHGNLNQAILGYNHSPTYVRDVLARARAYARAGDEQLATTLGEPTNAIGCADSDLAGPAGPANLRDAERVAAPRAYRALPSWALAGAQPAGRDRRPPLRRRRLDPAALPPARQRRPRSRPPHPRRRHRPRPHPRRRQRTRRSGTASAGATRPRPRLDPGLRALRHPPRLPARARHPVHRLRRLPRPRLAADLHR